MCGGQMKVKVLFRIILSIAYISSVCTVMFEHVFAKTKTQPIVIHSLYHHIDARCTPPRSMELVVLYASGGVPRICSADGYSVHTGATRQRTYRIEGVHMDSAVLQRFPLDSGKGYTVVAKKMATAVELSITYDMQRWAVGVSSCDTIGHQAGLAVHLCPMQDMSSSVNRINKQKVVVLDCGHGGQDTGAVSVAGVMEKTVALAVGLQLKKVLEEHDIHVIMTRTADKDVLLDARTSYANAHDAHLCISLHANYAAKTHASGIETWYLPKKITLVSDCSDHNELGYIKDLVAQRSCASSIPARYVHQKLISGAKKHAPAVVDRHVKSAISQVLLGCRMPAILIELGFVSNSIESQLLSDPLYQKIQAESIGAGVLAYFNYLDKLGK